MLFKRKKKQLRVVQIANVEWTKEDGSFTKTFVCSPTFKKLVAALNGYLVNNILRGAGDEYRRGYLACMADITNIGNVEDPVEDSKELVSMQEFEDD